MPSTISPAGKLFQIFFKSFAIPYAQMDVSLGTEGAPGHLSDQSTTLGVINVYREDESWLLPILQSWEFTD